MDNDFSCYISSWFSLHFILVFIGSTPFDGIYFDGICYEQGHKVCYFGPACFYAGFQSKNDSVEKRLLKSNHAQLYAVSNTASIQENFTWDIKRINDFPR